MTESASNQAATTAKRHYFVSMVTALGLSLLFWALFGVFDFVGFIFWTCISALLGSSIGLVLDRKIWISVVSTAAIRTLIFTIMMLVG